MIKYVIYSNTSYLDILEIQTEKIKNKGATLFIDNNDKDLTYIYSNYSEVIFYDESQTYAQRILTCVSQCDYDYFLLLHDIDILVYSNEDKLGGILSYMKTKNLDRIDIKRTQLTSKETVIDISSVDINSWVEDNDMNNDEKLYLVKLSDPHDYIYNVNPSFWKKSSLMDIMSRFTEKTYRTIEDMDVQNYCTKFEVYRTFSNNYKRCGYYDCINEFVFLHITHGGKYLSLNENKVTSYGQSYSDVYDEYVGIVNKYNLKQSTKW
jgi:hypothetical protein